jgi:mannose-6-phosphate isomerase-like protein (cupin superfamily)
MKETIKLNNKIIAIIIRAGFIKNGIEFFTPNDFSQQLGYMKREKGYYIEPHIHKSISREVMLTQEVLFIKSGKVRVDFYSDQRDYYESRTLNRGDVILLANSGHGFVTLEESEIIEVKQGPYLEEEDKVRFKAVADDDVIIKGEDYE